MRGARFTRAILAVLVIGLLLPGMLLAQGTGKIRGTVVDEATGDPIIGANVVLEGTSRGAATDLDGFFVILAIQPGKYTVRASAIGYAQVLISDVEINTDRSTELEFKLVSESLQLEVLQVIC